MMNEMELRKKMLEELMGQMDDRMSSKAMPEQDDTAMAMAKMAGEQGNMGESDVNEMENDMDEDDMTRRLRKASMMR